MAFEQAVLKARVEAERKEAEREAERKLREDADKEAEQKARARKEQAARKAQEDAEQKARTVLLQSGSDISPDLVDRSHWSSIWDGLISSERLLDSGPTEQEQNPGRPMEAEAAQTARDILERKIQRQA